MMKNTVTVTLAAVLFILLPGLAICGDIASLRGSNQLDKEAEPFDKKKQITKSGGFDRSWDLQPPSIPHKIDKDRLSVKENTCLNCHNKANHEKENAPEIGESHYKDRDGNVLGEMSSGRWFCNQCHTAQVDAAPLVNNTF